MRHNKKIILFLYSFNYGKIRNRNKLEINTKKERSRKTQISFQVSRNANFMCIILQKGSNLEYARAAEV